MLAFDIETTGLKRTEHMITVVGFFSDTPFQGCVEHEGGFGRTVNFINGYDKPDGWERQDTWVKTDRWHSMRESVISTLDSAPALCSFNGIRFDIPFIQTYLSVDARKVGEWVTKTFDVWETCKNLLRCTFPMKAILNANGIPDKLGSGALAVEWAKDPDMAERLEEYCLQDARATYLLSNKDRILLPIGKHDKGSPANYISASTYSIVRDKHGISITVHD